MTDDPSALAMVTTQLSKLQDTVTLGFRDLGADLARLRDETVHRREFDRYRDEMRLDWTEAVQKRDREIADLRDSHERIERLRVTDRRWLVGTLVGAVASFGALAPFVDMIVHRSN